MDAGHLGVTSKLGVGEIRRTLAVTAIIKAARAAPTRRHVDFTQPVMNPMRGFYRRQYRIWASVVYFRVVGRLLSWLSCLSQTIRDGILDSRLITNGNWTRNVSLFLNNYLAHKIPGFDEGLRYLPREIDGCVSNWDAEINPSPR
jgi:hypothetical protein